MEDTQSRRTFLYIIIAALLLHLLALLFLLAWQHHTAEHEKKFQEFMEAIREQAAMNPENSESTDWAEMKARASEFGTTVLFQDTPEYTPSSPIAQEKAQPKEKPQSIDREDTQSPEKVAATEKNPTEIVADQEQEIPSDQSYTRAHTNQAREGMNDAGKQDAAPEPPITLSTIAKGFLSTLDQGGTDSMGMNGKKGVHPSAEQLNYQRYMEKFWRCVNNSHNIHKSKLPPMDIRVQVDVAISLLRDGTLVSSYISRSSGIKEIDEYVLFIHRDAAPGFPPVPSSIGDHLLNFISQGIVIIGTEQTPFRFSMR